MTYVFDTSALIGAWVRGYPPDVFPGFWDKLDGLVDAGEVVVPEEVLDELKRQDDELLAWVKERADKMIIGTSRAVMLEARAVLADHGGLTKTGTGRGLADPFVIALAAIGGRAVVTQEQGGSGDKPRIPYVCEARSVECLNILQVIRAQGWRF